MDPAAKDEIIAAVREWQAENETSGKPPTQWFVELRSKLIARDRLTNRHCKDVCRNVVKSLFKEQQGS